MKAFTLVLAAILLASAAPASAEDAFGLPIPPEARDLERTENSVAFTLDGTHDEVLEYYRNVLKDQKDVRLRDWTESSYLEDDSNLPWHSITISKLYSEGTSVTIKKDTWTWILSTLFLRYVGVFVVLTLLWFGMSLSGAILSRTVGARAKPPAAR